MQSFVGKSNGTCEVDGQNHLEVSETVHIAWAIYPWKSRQSTFDLIRGELPVLIRAEARSAQPGLTIAPTIGYADQKQATRAGLDIASMTSRRSSKHSNTHLLQILWHGADKAADTGVEEKLAHLASTPAMRCPLVMMSADPARQSMYFAEGVTAQEQSRPPPMGKEPKLEETRIRPEAQKTSLRTPIVIPLQLHRPHLSTIKLGRSGMQYTGDFPTTQAASDPLLNLPGTQTDPVSIMVLLRDKLNAVIGMTPALQRGDGRFGNRDWLRRWTMHRCNVARLLWSIDLHGHYDEAYELVYYFDQLEKQQRLVQMRTISRRVEAQLSHLIDISSFVMEEGEYELPWPSDETISDR